MEGYCKSTDHTGRIVTLIIKHVQAQLSMNLINVAGMFYYPQPNALQLSPKKMCMCGDVHVTLRLFFKKIRFSDFVFEVFILRITTDTSL